MNRQFLFIKSATESIALPVDSFSHAEYTSDTTVSVYFNATRSGKDASIKVVLTVSSGNANAVVTSLTNQVATGSAPVMKYDDVTDAFYTKNVEGITSITTTEDPVSALTGQGVEPGGTTGQVLAKASNDDYDTEWVDYNTLYITVRNVSGGTLLKGTPVHDTGTTSSTPNVIAADASSALSMPATFVLNEDVANNSEGQAIIIGIIEDVDTSSFSAGDVIYVASGGGFTNVKPTGTNLIQNLGVVIKSSASSGSGVVLGAGRSNDVPNIADGYAWIGNASGVATPTLLADVATSNDYNDLSNLPSLLDASGTPANNQLAVWVDADTLEGDGNLTWSGTAFSVAGTAVVDRINVDEGGISSAGEYGSGSRVLDRVGLNTLSMTAGDLYYLSSVSWAQADADAASTASGLLAIATSTASNNGMLVSGVVKVANSSGFSSASEGDVLYVSLTAGDVTSDVSTYTTGDIVRVVGYVLDPTNGIIYFDPSKDWIELS